MKETIDDLKKRFGKVTYPESSEIGDHIFGDLQAKEGEFKREYAFIDTSKIEKKEQKKFTGLKKDDTVEFDVEKVFTDEALVAQLLGIPEDEAKSTKGKYSFKLGSISRTEPAEINVELFDRVFGKDAVKTEEEFTNKVKETISENYKREAEHFLDHNIEDYFLKNTKINLPDGFLKTWLKASSNGEVTDAVLEKEFDTYVRGLMWDLIKNKIADDNKISVDATEVRAKAKDLIVAQFGGQAFADQISDRLDAIADNYLQNENGQNFMRLYNQLRTEKILKFIRETITVQEKKVSVEEFKKIVKEHQH
jgi:trigger factor